MTKRKSWHRAWTREQWLRYKNWRKWFIEFSMHRLSLPIQDRTDRED